MSEKKKCLFCKQEKELEAFGLINKLSGQRHSTCRSCQSVKEKAKRAEKKKERDMYFGY